MAALSLSEASLRRELAEARRKREAPARNKVLSCNMVALYAKLSRLVGVRLMPSLPQSQFEADYWFNEAWRDLSPASLYARKLAVMLHDREAILRDMLRKMHENNLSLAPAIPFLFEVGGIFNIPHGRLVGLIAPAIMPRSINAKTPYRDAISEYHPDRFATLMHITELKKLLEDRAHRLADLYGRKHRGRLRLSVKWK